jgi:hypothetical protein
VRLCASQWAAGFVVGNPLRRALAEQASKTNRQKKDFCLSFGTQAVRRRKPSNYPGQRLISPPSFRFRTVSSFAYAGSSAYAASLQKAWSSGTARGDKHVQPTGILFGQDNAAAAVLTIDRRSNTPWDDNRYYSTSTLATAQYIEALTHFENMMRE